uniref:Uncharacterized protein n=1 Tax=Oreochromis niloticus TaxID=8128 RepID=A0A669CG66_ORENI
LLLDIDHRGCVPPGCASATSVTLDNLNPITVSFKCLPYQLLMLHYMSITVSMGNWSLRNSYLI